MRSSAVTAAAAGLLWGRAVQAQDTQGVVRWDIQRRAEASVPSRLGRRSGTLQQTISNDVALGGYFMDVTVGTPAQSMTLQLDTGSSDIWVVYSGASICSQQSSGGCPLGSFDPTSSTTFDDFGPGEFSITYVDGSGSTGDYFSDTFTIANATVTNMTMGLGTTTTIHYGLVGVGYQSNEAIVQTSTSTYPNLPVEMMDQGLINTIAYSLWLNDLDSSSGNILFGGIDTAKYQGTLTRISIYPEGTTYAAFIVALTSISAHSSSGSDSLSSSSFPVAVVLDSGTTLSYLPQDLAEQVWTEVGAEYSADLGLALLPCSRQSSTAYLSFGFAGTDGPVINVTMDELVLDMGTGSSATFSSGTYAGQTACYFGIQNLSSSSTYLLGDTFLRSAYVVYDLVNNEIGLAPTDFNATGSNIVAFASEGATIPSATVAPNQASVTQAGSSSQGTGSYSAESGFSAAVPAAAFGMDQVLLLVLGLVGSGTLLLLR